MNEKLTLWISASLLLLTNARHWPTLYSIAYIHRLEINCLTKKLTLFHLLCIGNVNFFVRQYISFLVDQAYRP